jgi:hypothetical protein
MRSAELPGVHPQIALIAQISFSPLRHPQNLRTKLLPQTNTPNPSSAFFDLNCVLPRVV